MGSENVTRYEGNLFIQTDPSDEYDFVTCTGIGNVTIPKGPRTIKYKQNLKRSGEIQADSAIKGQADFVTASITRPLETVYNYLHEISCPFNARINWACRGVRPIKENYEVAALLYDADFTTGTIETPQAGEGDNDRVNTTGELSATKFTYIYPLDAARQTLTHTTEVYSIAFLPSQCAGKCGNLIGAGQVGWAGMESSAYTGGYIAYTLDYGANWLTPVNQPFSVAGDVKALVLVDLASGYRVIAARGTSEGGNPAEVSYSDDEGDTWTDVNVGAVNGQTIQEMFFDEGGRIWAAATGGYIYRSDNRGVTWTAKESGVETVQDLNDIVMFDKNVGYCVGNSNAFLYTTDGNTWDARTGPAVAVNLLSVAVNASGHVFVTTADARIFRSVDGGLTWVLIVDLGAGSVDRIRFDDTFRYFGYLIYDNTTPVGTVYRSEDGGVTWNAIGTPAVDYLNAGLDCIAVMDPNYLYVGGAPQGGTSFIAKFTRKV